MNIIVSFKKKWGKELFYPESDDAMFLTTFTGRPTLLKRQLQIAVERGWSVKVVQPQFNLDEYLNGKPSKQRKAK